MLVRVLLFLVVLGLLYLMMAPKAHERVMVAPRAATAGMGNLAFGPPTLPPLPKNKLPISHTGQYPRHPGVPGTEMQLLQHPAMPALRTWSS